MTPSSEPYAGRDDSSVVVEESENGPNQSNIGGPDYSPGSLSSSQRRLDLLIALSARCFETPRLLKLTASATAGSHAIARALRPAVDRSLRGGIRSFALSTWARRRRPAAKLIFGWLIFLARRNFRLALDGGLAVAPVVVPKRTGVYRYTGAVISSYERRYLPAATLSLPRPVFPNLVGTLRSDAFAIPPGFLRAGHAGAIAVNTTLRRCLKARFNSSFDILRRKIIRRTAPSVDSLTFVVSKFHESNGKSARRILRVRGTAVTWSASLTAKENFIDMSSCRGISHTYKDDWSWGKQDRRELALILHGNTRDLQICFHSLKDFLLFWSACVDRGIPGVSHRRVFGFFWRRVLDRLLFHKVAAQDEDFVKQLKTILARRRGDKRIRL